MRKPPGKTGAKTGAKGAGKTKAKGGSRLKVTMNTRTKKKPKQAERQEPKPKVAPRVARAPAPDDGRSLEMAMRAVNAALDKKGIEPVLLDVRDMASYTDYILIVSARSDRQVQAIAEGISEALKQERMRTIGKEGARDGQWTLLDFGDVIVHVFYHQMRDYYDLESLWNDAPRVKLDIPPDARAQPEDYYEQSKV